MSKPHVYIDSPVTGGTHKNWTTVLLRFDYIDRNMGLPMVRDETVSFSEELGDCCSQHNRFFYRDNSHACSNVETAKRAIERASHV